MNCEKSLEGTASSLNKNHYVWVISYGRRKSSKMVAHLNNYHVFSSRSSNSEELVTLSSDNEYLDTEEPSNELYDFVMNELDNWRGSTLKLDVEDAILDKQNITLLIKTPRSASAQNHDFPQKLIPMFSTSVKKGV